MEDSQRFSLTPLGEALKSDALGAAQSTILNMDGKRFWNAFFKLPETLEDGEFGMEKAFGKSFFDYMVDIRRKVLISMVQ